MLQILIRRLVRLVRITRGLGASGAGLTVTSGLAVCRIIGAEAVSVSIDAATLNWLLGLSIAFTAGALIGRFESPISERWRERWASVISAKILTVSKHTDQTDLIEISVFAEIEPKRHIYDATSIDVSLSFGNSLPNWTDRVNVPNRKLSRNEITKLKIFDISFERTAASVDLTFRNGDSIKQMALDFQFILVTIKLNHKSGPGMVKFIYLRRNFPFGRLYSVTHNIEVDPGDSSISDTAWEYEFGPRSQYLKG